MEGKTMAIIVEGRVMTFLLMVIFFVLMYYFMVLNKDEQYTIRTMPALEAVSEAVGRAAEMGRPVLWTPGMSGALNNSNQGPQVLAAISILQYVTEECVKAGVHIQAITPLPDALPLVEETMRTAYLREGKPEEFDPSEQITFIAQQSPYLTGVLGYMNREKPASNILVGGFYYEAVVIGEAGNHIGAMQIGGTNNTHQMPFLVATCDYMLLAEELFAAGAAISQNRDMLGSIKGEDYMKIILMAITGIGFILGALNITIIADLLRM